MIDPKLNELPVNRSTATETADVEGKEPADRARRPRPGLSINDTVAGDSLLSAGSRGVDVSGVEAGAGAGAGSTSLTPGTSGSPAPQVMPGSRSTGTTPRATSASGQSPAGTAQSDATLPGVTRNDLTTDGEVDHFEQHEIAGRAYECWHERGCPSGSPEVDWHRAVQDLRERRRAQRQQPLSNSASV